MYLIRILSSSPLMIVCSLLLGISNPAFSSDELCAKTLSKTYVKEELTSHEWSLRQIVQTKNDTATNLTLFMLPCEKDNVLDYNENGTYIITEGEKLCKPSDDKIKGEGDWEFDEAEQAIVDRYNGGRRINKHILELTPGMLKVEYESEGNTITTLTYLSEIGQDDDSLEELIEDNSNYANNLELLPREAMLEARRYIVIGMADFERGVPLDIDDKNGLLKKVLIYPFIDATDKEETVREGERSQGLMAQARKSGIDYVVTGTIIKADAQPGPGDRYEGDVKYSVSILDVAADEEADQKIFEFSEREAEAGQQKDRNLLHGLARAISGYHYGGYGYYGYSSWRYRRWNYYYDDYFINRSSSGPNDGLGMAFSEDGQDERKKQFYTSLAIMNAINETSNDLGEYIMKALPVTIPINEVVLNNRGKLQGIIIEGGNNINLHVSEKVNLVRIQTKTMSNGDQVKSTSIVAEMVIKSIEGTRLATIGTLFGKKKIQEAIDNYYDELYVQTTELKEDSQ